MTCINSIAAANWDYISWILEDTMCFGLPMQVVAVDGFVARCAARGIEREVSLMMLQDEPVAAGDFVMVHLGHALEKMTPEAARSAWQLYDEAFGADFRVQGESA